jgi:hypothetical protein
MVCDNLTLAGKKLFHELSAFFGHYPTGEGGLGVEQLCE